jgi:hypothetical protein
MMGWHPAELYADEIMIGTSISLPWWVAPLIVVAMFIILPRWIEWVERKNT